MVKRLAMFLLLSSAACFVYGSVQREMLTAPRLSELRDEAEGVLKDMRAIFNQPGRTYKERIFDSYQDVQDHLDNLFGDIFSGILKDCESGNYDESIKLKWNQAVENQRSNFRITFQERWRQNLKKQKDDYRRTFGKKADRELKKQKDHYRSVFEEEWDGQPSYDEMEIGLFLSEPTIQKLAALSLVWPGQRFSTKKPGGGIYDARYFYKESDPDFPNETRIAVFPLGKNTTEHFPLRYIKMPGSGPLPKDVERVMLQRIDYRDDSDSLPGEESESF